ncbi:hypothetical protein HYH03_007422 [Edaphochlamys debaryana]|uniref:Ammonium transporter n=1 Tax=Edaphochlamys debaryana TaxID=47281 RepID=A0A836BZ63_9CHLO|nr:hypothetical protein HYH03_007422 [Edaphochlamys debaryana]|eukprot:KAG2494365.1 hypothetical protein HYH03_007422 [Edaphochlamys debaryana]
MASPSPLNLGGCSQQQYDELIAALGPQQPASVAVALCNIFTTRDRTTEVAFGLNTVFMILSGALVFIMHGGFAMLEAGAIRSKNAMNILLQTVLDGAASALMWYLVGYGFAYGVGDNPNGFIGDADFALARYASHNPGAGGYPNWTAWFFQWAFCATAATIPAGAVAERFNFNAYLGYSLFLGGFVYPVVVHWVWCPTGWLGYLGQSPLLGTGMIDFAGSGVVHMVGGLAGLTGAALVGPRLGRFDMDGRPVPMPGHSAILVVLGTVLLWFGWYGFNPGSALTADTPNAAIIAGRAAVTTTLSGAAGGLTCLLLGFVRHVAWDLISLCNGMLVGFVSITAGCHVLEPWAALIAGAVGAVVFELSCALLLRLRVDDVVSAGPMHGLCGAWGVVIVGLLAKQEYVQQAYVRDDYPYGLFYGGGGKLLASQVIGILAIGGWVMGTMGPFFLAFRAAGALRISAEDEHTGLDVSKHGGSAYHLHPQGGGGAFHTGAGAGGAGLTHMGLGLYHTGLGSAEGGEGHEPQHSHLHTMAGKAGVGDSIMRGATLGFANGGGISYHHSVGGGNFSSHHPTVHSVASNHSAGVTMGLGPVPVSPVAAIMGAAAAGGHGGAGMTNGFAGGAMTNAGPAGPAGARARGSNGEVMLVDVAAGPSREGGIKPIAAPAPGAPAPATPGGVGDASPSHGGGSVAPAQAARPAAVTGPAAAAEGAEQ